VRALSAIGFTISIIGLLLALYNQLAVIPLLNELYSAETQSYELSIHLTEKYEMQQYIISILCIVIGAFSSIFCSFVYLRKRTRMTIIGTIVGFVVTVMGIIHSW
jgi:hypothetical protein